MANLMSFEQSSGNCLNSSWCVLHMHAAIFTESGAFDPLLLHNDV